MSVSGLEGRFIASDSALNVGPYEFQDYLLHIVSSPLIRL